MPVNIRVALSMLLALDKFSETSLRDEIIDEIS